MKSRTLLCAIASICLAMCLSLTPCPSALSPQPMTQSHLEPADIAADELLTVLQARKTAGDFTDLLSDISDIIGEVSGRTIAADNLIIAKRDVPLTYIGDLDENLNVSVMAGPEGVRELNTDSSCLEEFTVDVAIELHMDRGNSLANPLMRQLGRKVSDWIMFTDGDADRRQRRRLTTIDSLVKRHQDVAKYDPLELLNNSVFLSLKRFTFDAVT